MGNKASALQFSLTVALVSASCVVRANSLQALLDGLESAKRRVLFGRASADLFKSGYTPPSPLSLPGQRRPPPEGPKVKYLKFRWAFAGQKWLLSSDSGAASAWDGKTRRVRTPYVGMGPGFGEMGPGATGAGIDAEDPIETGYRLTWPSADSRPESLWYYDLVRRARPTAEVLEGGRIRATFHPVALEKGSRIVVTFDPDRGYMADQVERVTISKPYNGKSYRTQGRVRVLNAVQCSGVWIPTNVVEETLSSVNVLSSTDWRLENVTSNFDDRIFSAIYRPGDKVRDGTTFFLVDSQGRLHQLPDESWEKRSEVETTKQYWTLIGGICAAILVVFAIGRASLSRKSKEPSL